MFSENEDPRGRVRDLKEKVNRALRRNAEFGDYAGGRRRAGGKYSHRSEHAWFRRRGFGWFRPKNLESVLGFAVGFGACLIVSIFLGVKAEKTKNQEMNQALRRVQEKQKH